jgi:hypothetical protein
MSDTSKVILLVEDTPDDATQTLRAINRGHVMNTIALARDRIGYLRKPVDLAEFVEAVKVLGMCWLTMNQGPPEWTTP